MHWLYEGIPGIEGTVGCPAGPPGPRVDESRAYDIIYEAYPYLKSRLLHHKLNKFGYSYKTNELYVFNLTPENKVIGFQVRSLGGNGPKYKTLNKKLAVQDVKPPFEFLKLNLTRLIIQS